MSGIKKMLTVVNQKDRQMWFLCLLTTRTVTMDSRIGLDYIVENKDYTTKLAAGVCSVHSD